MLPNGSIASFYAKIVGQASLLAFAQSNLLSHLERVAKVRTHTYLANNAQTQYGISQNFGAVRHYSWNDTVIDCRNCPNLVESRQLQDFDEVLSENKRFIQFQDDLEERLGGYIQVLPFYSVLRGEENMRYNIRRDKKIEDFDIIRIGMKLQASDENQFKLGLQHLKDQSNPFKLKAVIKHNTLNAMA